jgi:hypothetical protein
MTLFRGQTSRAKMTSAGGKLITVACHPTKKVNKAKEITYLSSTNNGLTLVSTLKIIPVNFWMLKVIILQW